MKKSSPLFAVVLVSCLVFSASCVTREVQVTETYYETEHRTEYKTETYTVTEDVVVKTVEGKKDLQPVMEWSDAICFITYDGPFMTYYYGYKINTSGLRGSQVKIVMQKAEGRVGVYNLTGVGQIAPLSTAQLYGETQVNWLHRINGILTDLERILKFQLIGGEITFDAEGTEEFAILANTRLSPISSVQLVWSEDIVEKKTVTKERQVPYQMPVQVEKQRTGLRTKSVPFWEVIFSQPPGQELPPVINSFEANPLNVNSGQVSTLSWDVSNAISVEIDQGIGNVGPHDRRSVSLSSTTKYSLTATNDKGSVTAATQVVVTQLPEIAGKIAFVSTREGNSEIYVMDPDGSGLRNLTNNSAFDGSPAWSPDSNKIAFVSTRDGNSKIYVMNPDGSGLKNLTNTPALDGSPAWSPTGNRIAFERHEDDFRLPVGNRVIYVMDSNGSIPKGITASTFEDVKDTEPAWSPDGNKIAFASTRDGNFEVYVMNPEGSGPVYDSENQSWYFKEELERLTNNLAKDSEPAWSPDGSKIAFTTDRDGNFEIYVMNPDGSGLKNLTNNPAKDSESAWSSR